MGTQHLIAVKTDGTYKIAQYGQWDGYPKGQGATVLEFLKSNARREKLQKKCAKLRFGTPEELAALAKPFGGSWARHLPQMTRDIGGKILQVVHDGEDGMLMSNQLDFLADSLMCEFAYVVDFDNDALEVFQGFNKLPLLPDERFYDLESKCEAGSKYHPVKLLTQFKLSELPNKNDFLAACEAAQEVEA